MVVQAAPGSASAPETMCTMNFGIRVKGVELGPAQVHRNQTTVLDATTTQRQTPKSASMQDLCTQQNSTVC